MITENDVLALFDTLERARLHAWIQSGWVRPARRGRAYLYREIDVARIGLIREISEDLAVAEDDLPLVLSLIDQVHGLRRELKRVCAAIDAEPADIRARIARHLAG